MDVLSAHLVESRRLIDRTIDAYLPPAETEPRAIHACMRYCTDGGKRLRPIVALAIAEMLGCAAERILPTCCAIEFIHTHSLILDDMPCMDNDDFRRGRLASHKVFGEGVALLAADALLNLAIAVLGANHRVAGMRPEIALDVIREVGESVGINGMIGGQVADLAFSGEQASGGALERIHAGKTAKLFRLSARSAALVADATPGQLGRISVYAENFGLAFQIVDDVLDREGGEHGVWRRLEPSYARTYGVARARALAEVATARAVGALAEFGGEADVLRLLARSNLVRES